MKKFLLTAVGAAQRELAQVAHLAALEASLSGFAEAERAQLLALLASWRASLGVAAEG